MFTKKALFIKRYRAATLFCNDFPWI